MPIEEKDLKTILDDIGYLIAARQEASVKAMLLSLRSEDIAHSRIKKNACMCSNCWTPRAPQK